MSASSGAHRHLPRLTREDYQGFAFVHWVMTIEARATGWLDALFHARWRESLLHTQVRYQLFCPAYCLMPDHVHLIWIGCDAAADQRLAAAFLRRITRPVLGAARWQTQSFDHVLRESERERGAFGAACHYTLQNPVRKHLRSEWREYPYSGASVPGFPDLDPRRADFWDVFWPVYSRRVNDACDVSAP